ncbi:MAG TPA: hypothetical protein VHB99_10270, partial [Pirellulales bacterium]|nr:hypothetical protein [Pirellulales bacterium]
MEPSSTERGQNEGVAASKFAHPPTLSQRERESTRNQHKPAKTSMTRVAILGATGYSALELIKILLRHPGAEIVAVTSRQEGRPPIASVHP